MLPCMCAALAMCRYRHAHTKKKGTMMTRKETHRHMVGGKAITALLAAGPDSKGFTVMAL